MHNNNSLALLDHARQYRERRRDTGVSAYEDVYVGAFGPVDGERGVDGAFDVVPVEVERRDLGLLEGAWEAEDVPEDGLK